MNDMTQKPMVTVGIAVAEADKAAIRRLGQQVLLQDAVGQTPSDPERQRALVEWEEHGTLFYARKDGEIIGGIRLHVGTAADFPDDIREGLGLSLFQSYAPERPVLAYASRLAVLPNEGSGEVLRQLFAEAYRFALERGAVFLFCHCAPQLVRLYEQLGYRRYTHRVSHSDAGFHIPMVLVTDDVYHLRKVRSPFYLKSGEWGKAHVRETADWFAGQFPEAGRAIVQRTMDENRLWDLIHEKLGETQHRKPLIFRRLEEKEINLLLSQATVLQCDEGERIVQDGNAGNEMYVVLAGVVEVTKSRGDKTYSIGLFGEGEVFGEMAFVSETTRTATVTAIMNAEVLVLTRQFFDKLIALHPTIAAKVLLNLSVILCGRLGRSTDRWLDVLSKPDMEQ